MRVQTLVRIYDAGIASCQECCKWDRCFSVEIDKSFYGEYCSDCLTKQAFEAEKKIELYSTKQRKRTQKKAKRSEAKTAKETGGRCVGYVPSSGDSRNSKYFFEDKTRIGGDKKSYRLTQDVVLKGRDQARRANLTPVYRVHLKDVSIGVMLWDDLVELVSESDDEHRQQTSTESTNTSG